MEAVISSPLKHPFFFHTYLVQDLLIFIAFSKGEIVALIISSFLLFQDKWRSCPGSLGPGAAPGLRTVKTPSVPPQS